MDSRSQSAVLYVISSPEFLRFDKPHMLRDPAEEAAECLTFRELSRNICWLRKAFCILKSVPPLHASVAFTVIKMEKLREVGREREKREGWRGVRRVNS